MLIVRAEVLGPAIATRVRLVVDTRAAATTLIPQVIQDIGYSQPDGYKKATVQTAVGGETGFWLRIAEFSVFGVTIPNFALAVFPLRYPGIGGLVGMNFLRHFNFEVRPAERRIFLELIEKSES